MPSRDLNDLDQKLHGLAIDFLMRCRNVGLNVFIDCTYRSCEEQNALYAQGRTAPGEIVTHAKGGESAHNYVDAQGKPAARAFDIGIFSGDTGEVLDWNANDSNWAMAHDIGKDLGLVLGADWPEPVTDGPHFELPDWQVS